MHSNENKHVMVYEKKPPTRDIDKRKREKYVYTVCPIEL